MNLDQIILKKMIENKIRPSLLRTRIYKYLLEDRSHPTADTIYKALQQELGALSKTTVYNTLKLFVEKGIICSLGIEAHELRYDANVHWHGHFKCTACNKMFDFDYNFDSDQIADLAGFKLATCQINATGLCLDCKQKVE